MIDLAPLLRLVALEYGQEHADDVAALVEICEVDARESASRVVRRPDLTGVVASSFLTVQLLEAAMTAERVGGHGNDAARILRFVAGYAAVDAGRYAAQWARTATAGDGGTQTMG